MQRFMRIHDVIKTTGLSRALVYREMNAGRFPRSIAISAKAVAWLEEEVEAWQAERLAAREGDPSNAGVSSDDER